MCSFELKKSDNCDLCNNQSLNPATGCQFGLKRGSGWAVVNLLLSLILLLGRNPDDPPDWLRAESSVSSAHHAVELRAENFFFTFEKRRWR